MKAIYTLLLFAILAIPNFAVAQTFTENIAEIIYNKCSVCHRPGEIGPQSFTNYDEIKNWATTIQSVTTSKYMPPWQPDPNYARYLGENYLTDEEINLISDWVNSGAPKGPDSAEPAFPNYPDGSLLGDPDLVLSFSEAHTHIGNNRDEYRYFVLPSGLTEDKVIKAIEFRPGNTKIVHHALLFEDTEGVAAARDAQTSEYGFEGEGGFNGDNNISGVLDQKQYPGYVPGQKPILFSEGMGQTLAAGADIVIQVHYAPWSTTEQDSSSVNLFFADENETIDRLVQDTIMLPSNFTPGGLTGFLSFFVNPGEVKTFHAQYVLEEDLSFIGVSPHMHLLGKDWLVYIEHSDGSQTNIIDIPEWDFNWQGNYFFPRLLVAEEGDIVHAFATYDNTSQNPFNPSNPPVLVQWGENTTDEMFYLPLMYVPYQNGDEDVVFDPTLNNQEVKINEATLFPIVPNPVSDEIKIEFKMDIGGPINVKILDINGQLIRNLRNNEFFAKGAHALRYNTEYLSNGTYIVQFDGKDFSVIKKFIKL